MGRVPLNRALSKLRILSRAQATAAIRAGRVRIDGRVVRDPAMLVDVDRIDRAGPARITVDDEPLPRLSRAAWQTIVFDKPRGVVRTRSDPDGRRTICDVLGDDGRGLIAVGRLDAIGHEVTRLKRVRLGTIELGDLEAGAWRALTREDVRAAFQGAL